MIISLNWLKKYVDINVSASELVELIGSRLVEVEEVVDLAPKYKDCLVVRVEKCEKVEGSDHLSLCQVDTGESDLAQVVCGANNVHAGMLAVWLPPKSIAPETYGTDDEFTLEARKLMGQTSNGMLASPRELGLWDEHEGIVEISGTNEHPLIGPGEFFGTTSGQAIKPGTSFTELFELDDVLLDIEPKSLTHRPDCFGIIGFAREVAGILGQEFKEPSIFKKNEVKTGKDVELKVVIDDPELCPRYEGIVLSNISDSAMLSGRVKTYLARSGMRPINATVDVTNFLMLETGQPLHAFDYDKLCQISPSGKPEIFVRPAKDGEKLTLLDGKEVDLAENDIVICAGDKQKSVPIALAGAMGGLSTAIDEGTKNVLIESATFNLYNLRGTQFRHGIFSEAITRFTKGQPAPLTDYVIRAAATKLTTFACAKVASEIVDAYPKPMKSKPIKISIEKINGVLGSGMSFDEIIATLENVGFVVKLDGEAIIVTSPWWRTDIHIAEDVIEEVGRLSGYDNIPLDTPGRGFVAPAIDKLGELKSKIRRILSDAGANEILTYSFVSERLLNQVGQDSANSYKIINSISPELQCVRQSLTPSILEKVWLNVKVPYDHFALFEINQVYQKAYGLTDEKVPVMRDKVALTLCDRKRQGDAYYDALRLVRQLLNKLNIKFDIVQLTDTHASDAPFEPKRSAQIKTPDHKICFGVVGEYRRAVLKNLKLPEYTAGFELNIDKIHENLGRVEAKPVMENATEQDLTFRVGADLVYTDLANLIDQTLQGLSVSYDIAPISIYQGDDKSTKNISFRLVFASLDKTLTGEEIAAIIDQITAVAAKQLNAKVI